MPNILCTICMRKGSREVPNKNLTKINSQYLFYYTINQAKKSKLFNKIIISTDSSKIRNLAKKYGIDCWFLRPKNLSKNNSPKLPVVRHALIESEKYFEEKFDYVVDLDATSPLRSVEDIKKAYKKFIYEKSKNLITVYKADKNPYFNQIEYKKNKYGLVKKNIIKNPTRRQDAPKVYNMNASIYIWQRNYLIRSDTIFSNKTSVYVMPKERSIDIDSKFDLKIVKYLLSKNN